VIVTFVSFLLLCLPFGSDGYVWSSGGPPAFCIVPALGGMMGGWTGRWSGGWGLELVVIAGMAGGRYVIRLYGGKLFLEFFLDCCFLF